jgi:acyl-CoA thioesterase FadM
VVSTATIRYRREMRLGQAFRLDSRILCWDKTSVVMEQTFTLLGGPRNNQLATRALVKVGLYDKTARAFVPVATLMQTIGMEAQSPQPAPEVEAFLNADAELREAARS